MLLFHFWSRDAHPVQNLMLCTKFHQNRMIFHLDMAIYWFSKWRPSAILEYCFTTIHHTRPPTKSLLLAAAACQISCQSDTHRSEDVAIWIFRIFGLKCPQNGGFGGLWTPKCDYSSSRPQKPHPCINPRLLSYQL